MTTITARMIIKLKDRCWRVDRIEMGLLWPSSESLIRVNRETGTVITLDVGSERTLGVEIAKCAGHCIRK